MGEMVDAISETDGPVGNLGAVLEIDGTFEGAEAPVDDGLFALRYFCGADEWSDQQQGYAKSCYAHSRA